MMNERVKLIDTQTHQKTTKLVRDVSEFMHILANEPSVGLYYVSDNVRSAVPKNVEIKVEEVTYDADYCLSTLRSLQDLTTFTSIHGKMEYCLALAKDLKGRIPAEYPSRVPQESAPRDEESDNSDASSSQSSSPSSSETATSALTSVSESSALVLAGEVASLPSRSPSPSSLPSSPTHGSTQVADGPPGSPPGGKQVSSPYRKARVSRTPRVPEELRPKQF